MTDAGGRPPRSAATLVTVLLVLLAVAAVCGAAFLAIRLLIPRAPAVPPGAGSQTPVATLTGAVALQTPSPGAAGQAQIAIDPAGGSINTLVTVTGKGWWPGEAVFIFLRSPGEASEHGFTYAAAVADNAGRIRTAFTFPNEMRWLDQSWAEVIGRGNRSNLEATARFELLTPTATNTAPIPTAPPYTPPSATPPRPTRTPTQTGTPTATMTPTPPVITDWRGEYYANPSLAGEPALVRNDIDVNFYWGTGSPAPGLPADGFSARWTRSVQFAAGWYRFTAVADDGVRLSVDNRPIIDQWRDGSATYTAEVRLSQGMHALRVEYYENSGGAAMQLTWERLATTPTPPVITDWRGEYFDNPSLAGDPALVRNDITIDFNWGTGSPAPGLPVDGFSARWTRSLHFTAGWYRFTAVADDGVRLSVDDRLILDEWHDGQATYTADVHLAQGAHALRVEYYENVGGAAMQLGWTALGLPTATPTAPAPTDIPTPPVVSGWQAEYYDNQELAGSPVLVRGETAIDFEWGNGSPGEGIPGDHFSARWSRAERVTEGTYHFEIAVDDGVRLLIDGQPIINEWHDGQATYSADAPLSEGEHLLVVEYYENVGNARIHFSFNHIK